MSDSPNIDASIRVAAACRALSDPFRLHAFALLLRHERVPGEADPESIDMAEAIDDIAHELNMSPELVEQHIMELVRAGLGRIVEDLRGRPALVIETDLVNLVRHYVDGAPGALS